MECSEPGLVRDEDLFAYLAGERVRPGVAQHIAQCPRCSNQLTELRLAELSLISRLYRWDCPPNQVLGEFQLGMLDPETALAIKFHLRSCVDCSAELSTLGGFLAGDPMLAEQPLRVKSPQAARNNHHTPEIGVALNRMLDQASSGVRQIIATLLPQPRLMHQRTSATTDLWPRRYAAEDFSISLQVEREVGRGSALQLIGFISRKNTTLEALQGLPVRLSSHTETVSAQNVDALGNFVFSALVPATYKLEVQAPDGTIVIDQLPINIQDM